MTKEALYQLAESFEKQAMSQLHLPATRDMLSAMAQAYKRAWANMPEPESKT